MDRWETVCRHGKEGTKGKLCCGTRFSTSLYRGKGKEESRSTKKALEREDGQLHPRSREVGSREEEEEQDTKKRQQEKKKERKVFVAERINFLVFSKFHVMMGGRGCG